MWVVLIENNKLVCFVIVVIQSQADQTRNSPGDNISKRDRVPKCGVGAPEPLLGDQSGTFGFYGYDYLLVINCTQGRILHCFRHPAFDRSKIAIFGYPSHV